MKYIHVTQKTSRKTADTSSHEASAGSNGIAIAPPAYGIDFVDREPAEAGSLSLNPPSLIQAKPMTAPPGEHSRTIGGYKKNKTGLPDNLKAGVENLSGLSMDDVSVHYNSPKPEQLQAWAYTQGTDIHVGPGQERHVPHEAWHVVQQKQGRVKPTMQMKGTAINADSALEREAEEMGARAKADRRRAVHDASPTQRTGLENPEARRDECRLGGPGSPPRTIAPRPGREEETANAQWAMASRSGASATGVVQRAWGPLTTRSGMEVKRWEAPAEETKEVDPNYVVGAYYYLIRGKDEWDNPEHVRALSAMEAGGEQIRAGEAVHALQVVGAFLDEHVRTVMDGVARNIDGCTLFRAPLKGRARAVAKMKKKREEAGRRPGREAAVKQAKEVKDILRATYVFDNREGLRRGWNDFFRLLAGLNWEMPTKRLKYGLDSKGRAKVDPSGYVDAKIIFWIPIKLAPEDLQESVKGLIPQEGFPYEVQFNLRKIIPIKQGKGMEIKDPESYLTEDGEKFDLRKKLNEIAPRVEGRPDLEEIYERILEAQAQLTDPNTLKLAHDIYAEHGDQEAAGEDGLMQWVYRGLYEFETIAVLVKNR